MVMYDYGGNQNDHFCNAQSMVCYFPNDFKGSQWFAIFQMILKVVG